MSGSSMKAIAAAVVASVGVATVVSLKKQVKDEMEEQNQLVEENEYLRKEIEFLTREISISQDVAVARRRNSAARVIQKAWIVYSNSI